MGYKKSAKKNKVRCREFFKCKKKECPAYNSEDLRCWLFSGTHCRNEIQGKFLEKMEICIDCEIFKRNMDIKNVNETFNLLNKQLKEFRQFVNKRDRELKRLAITDKLTGAFNRTKFVEILKREIEMVSRYDQPLSLILFDIDHFKKTNDTYGHNAGDHVLKTIADIVRENIRKIDYFVRWGGEEFIILSSETDLEEAHTLAERIRKAIENYRFKNIGKVTISFGVTKFREGDTEELFIKRADDAMYEAKKKGRNRGVVRV